MYIFLSNKQLPLILIVVTRTTTISADTYDAFAFKELFSSPNVFLVLQNSAHPVAIIHHQLSSFNIFRLSE